MFEIDHYRSKSIKWNSTDYGEFLYNAYLDGKSLNIRLNDFPSDKLHTLIVGDDKFDFADRPSVWASPDIFEAW